ncbi:MAG: hypothetical protein V1885_03400 [Candidatus Brennerbacteria bacterium]
MTETRQCQNCRNPFVIEPDDFAFYERIKVPPPTWCPECRMIRRMAFRSERPLFKDFCDLCRKEIISMYGPEKPYKVYCNACWFSDKWDGTEYGREYDFSRPFFAQFAGLLAEVPRMALEAYQNENSPYSNFTWMSKNIYLSPSSMFSENILFTFGAWYSTDLVDCFRTQNSSLGYYLVESNKCSSSRYLTDSLECLDSAFLFDCRNCRNCFMSSGLRNKTFYFRNTQLTREEYEKKFAEIDMGSFTSTQKLIAEFNELMLHTMRKYAILSKVENVTGDMIFNSKNVHRGFNGKDSENLKFVAHFVEAKDSMDAHGVGPSGELIYEVVNGGYKDQSVFFVTHTYEGMNLVWYCDYCRLSGKNLFGCAGLKHKQYCILNKQYTKEEYEELVPKIIKHMNDMPYVDEKGRVYRYGEFFPPELSPSAYNETIAQEYFPLTKEQALSRGYRWRDPDTKEYKVTKPPQGLPDHIKDVDDSILQETIGCAHEGFCTHQCTTAFKVIPEELAFYRRMNLPLPRLCPNCRHYERLSERNPMKLWHRQCMCDKPNHPHHGRCPNEFETSYAPERPETIYCEQCYNAEVA